MKVRIKFLIFQNKEVDEELESEQEFTNATELALALTRFAAQESAVRFHPSVMVLYTSDGPRLNMPSAQQGYGPATNVVIKKIAII